MQRRTIRQVKNALWSALKKWYVGEGLYININEVIIQDPCIEDEETPDGHPADSYMIKGTYGRYNELGDESLNFNFNFDLSYTDDDSDEFIAGMFYCLMCQNEGAI